MSGSPPGLELVECLVRERDLATSQAAQQVRDRTKIRRAPVELAQRAAGIVHRDEHVVQRHQIGAYASRVVIKQLGKPVGQSAAGAEAMGV